MNALKFPLDRPIDPQRVAKRAGLAYVNGDEPGIQRLRCGTGFRYVYAGGRALRGRRPLERIDALAVPPAWEDVWICRRANGHLQATGHDDRGRKQYLYHERWREVMDRLKFAGLSAFAEALPDLRRQVAADLRRRKLSRRKVAALAVHLLDRTGMRVGSAEYARDNDSYGLTTLVNEHVRVRGGTLEFEFDGKGGAEQFVTLHDRRIANFVRRCRDAGGEQLLVYEEAGVLRPLDAEIVNEYLHEAVGSLATAKTLRLWRGSAVATSVLDEHRDEESASKRRRLVTKAIDAAADRLGNTRTICRRYYVHPAIPETFVGGEWPEEPPGEPLPTWRSGERLLQRLLAETTFRIDAQRRGRV